MEAKCPGVISGIREWLRWYKTPDGKPLNAFGYEERALDKKHAMEMVRRYGRRGRAASGRGPSRSGWGASNNTIDQKKAEGVVYTGEDVGRPRCG